MKAFLRWWLLFCLLGIGTTILYYLGLFSDLYDADASKISFLILTLFTGITCYVGLLTHRLWKKVEVAKKQIETCWFLAGSLSHLGMIGTVIGFMMMLGPVFASLDITQVQSIQGAMLLMGSGMSTALTTTLVGMSGSLLIQLQLVNIDEPT